MTTLLVIFCLIVVGCIIRYAVTGSASSTPNNNNNNSNNNIKPLSELSLDELKAKLSEINAELEKTKIEYQGSLSNPYCLPVTRNLIKNRLDITNKRRDTIINIINKKGGRLDTNSNQINVADELKKLKELLDSGVLTQQEFETQKKKLLNI